MCIRTWKNLTQDQNILTQKFKLSKLVDRLTELTISVAADPEEGSGGNFPSQNGKML